MSLTQAIKAEALRLGFHFIGITAPDPPAHFAAFERWLDTGRQGALGYLETERSRQRRADPRLILPECRSVVVLGSRYEAPQDPDPPGARQDFIGRVAAYAWGADYHEVLPARLQALVAFIEDQVGRPVPNRWYTDTGPVLERDLAQRAGLGWIGKNTCLINPEQGSYFLLSEILVGVELEANLPFLPDRCGSCTRCLEACPTTCILPDRTIDARRCISYLTIELKGPIPTGLRPQVGEWVFGCDVCQRVCPWNRRFSGLPGDPAFAPRPETPLPDLVRELSLTPQEFNRKFKGSPVKRAKRRGYLRNVATALGNALREASEEQASAAKRAAAALRQTMREDPEPLVRAHAAWALGQALAQPFLQAAARLALAEAMDTETDPDVLVEIQAALGG